jgi:hypothetical protein
MISIKRGENNKKTVAHTCNPSYSGGRDQEDRSSKPALVSRIPNKKGPVEWLKV